MATIKATAHAIQWDVDEPGDLAHLPDRVNVTIYIEGTESTISAEEIDDAISDAITNETGFCHKGFAVSHCDLIEDQEK
ncbi:hypothetical protein [Marinobacter salsuginis]|jgi:hypothetical protein|uniref:Uncharacterized protein n=1 Tax=Marinobacter salsuginis TaxID=418719 RepID=A0A5M3Q104_9GAMM|nr:hypothetical protein [Marinobacter salsuginis]GBO88731.1 hypothetical protein MSSD14B_23990 [Marinobacter salsuginis]